MHTEIISVPARFAGPPGYANGGWIAGMIAQALDLNPAQVTLRSPVPLETDLILTADRLMVGETLIAEIAPGDFTRDVPPFVSVTEAIAAESRSHVRSTELLFGGFIVCGFIVCGFIVCGLVVCGFVVCGFVVTRLIVT